MWVLILHDRIRRPHPTCVHQIKPEETEYTHGEALKKMKEMAGKELNESLVQVFQGVFGKGTTS